MPGPEPTWLRGLIARHGQPLIVREVDNDGDELQYLWPHTAMSVRIGRTFDTHYVIAGSDLVTARRSSPAEPTASDVAGTVALAGLDDQPAARS